MHHCCPIELICSKHFSCISLPGSVKNTCLVSGPPPSVRAQRRNVITFLSPFCRRMPDVDGKNCENSGRGGGLLHEFVKFEHRLDYELLVLNLT